MKTHVLFLLASLMVACIISAGCSFTTAHFKEVTMAKSVDENYKPIVKTATFHKHDPVLHCSALIANAPSETKVKAVWLYRPEDGEIQRVDSAEITVESREWIDFSFRPANAGLPYGSYSVELFIDGAFKQSVPFAVAPMFTDGVLREATIAASVSEQYFPTGLATEFPPSVEAIYAPVFVEAAPLGTAITVRWSRAIEGETGHLVSTDFAIQEDGWSGWIGFSLTPSKPLPSGPYRADVLINGQAITALNFKVN